MTGVAALALLAAQADGAGPSVAPDPVIVVVPAVSADAPPPATTIPVASPDQPQTAIPAAEVPAAEAQQAQPDPSAVEGDAIVVTAKPKHDPLMGANAASFNLTQDIDRALVAPIAMAYKKALPKPARVGLGNFIRNISAPIVFINDLLQLKPGRAFKTLARFTINTTIGIGGLIDVAKDKPFNLPYRHNGFANTLGYYGVGPGPYLYIPFIGPTTLRDIVGGVVDGVVMPYGIGAPFNKAYYTIPNGAVRSLNRRVEFDCQLQIIRESGDPYAAERAYYLKKRQAEIDELHGRGTGPEPAAQCEEELTGKAKQAVSGSDQPATEPATAPIAAPTPASPPVPEAVPAPAQEPAAAPAPSN